MDAVDVVLVEFQMMPQDIIYVCRDGHMLTPDLLHHLGNHSLDMGADIYRRPARSGIVLRYEKRLLEVGQRRPASARLRR